MEGKPLPGITAKQAMQTTWKPSKIVSRSQRFLIKKATQAIPGKGSEGKTWLLKELASELRKETGVKLSLFHIFKVLRDNGISLDRRDSVYTPSGQDS